MHAFVVYRAILELPGNIWVSASKGKFFESFEDIATFSDPRVERNDELKNLQKCPNKSRELADTKCKGKIERVVCLIIGYIFPDFPRFQFNVKRNSHDAFQVDFPPCGDFFNVII